MFWRVIESGRFRLIQMHQPETALSDQASGGKSRDLGLRIRESGGFESRYGDALGADDGDIRQADEGECCFQQGFLMVEEGDRRTLAIGAAARGGDDDFFAR